jgi:hypothetical protein
MRNHSEEIGNFGSRLTGIRRCSEPCDVRSTIMDVHDFICETAGLARDTEMIPEDRTKSARSL